VITDFLGDGMDLFDSPAAPSRRQMSSPSTPLALFYVVEPGDAEGDAEDYLDFNVPLIRCNLNRGRYLEFLAPYWDGSRSRLQYLADVRERVEQINTALHWWKSNVRSSARAGQARGLKSWDPDDVLRDAHGRHPASNTYLNAHFDPWSCKLLAFGAVLIGGSRAGDSTPSLLRYCVKERAQFTATDLNGVSLLYVAVLQQRFEQVRA
jgi:hypothetical protein